MELTQRVRSFLVLAAVVTAACGWADRPSRAEIRRRLQETREVWETLQADRYAKLKLGVRVLGNDPAFKAAIATDQATVYDMLRERGQDLRADFFIATNPAGIVIARSDRPTTQKEGAFRAVLGRPEARLSPKRALRDRPGGRAPHRSTGPVDLGRPPNRRLRGLSQEPG